LRVDYRKDFFDMMSMITQLESGDVNADGTKPEVF